MCLTPKSGIISLGCKEQSPETWEGREGCGTIWGKILCSCVLHSGLFRFVFVLKETSFALSLISFCWSASDFPWGACRFENELHGDSRNDPGWQPLQQLLSLWQYPRALHQRNILLTISLINYERIKLWNGQMEEMQRERHGEGLCDSMLSLSSPLFPNLQVFTNWKLPEPSPFGFFWRLRS